MEYANSVPAHCWCTSNNLIYGYIADIHFYPVDKKHHVKFAAICQNFVNVNYLV